jgi:hypothetical protein
MYTSKSKTTNEKYRKLKTTEPEAEYQQTKLQGFRSSDMRNFNIWKN